MTESNINIIRELTEKIKEHERQLHRQQNFLQSLLDSMDDLVFVLDTNGNFIDSFDSPSPKKVPLFKPKKEFIGKHHTEVMPHYMHHLVNSSIENIRNFQDTQQIEYYLDYPDNGRRWFDARLSPIRNTYTNFAGIVVVVRDITERKQAEEVLRATKDQLQQVTENVGAGLLIVSREKKIVWANKVMLGKYPDIIGNSCTSVCCRFSLSDCPSKKVFDGEQKVVHYVDDDDSPINYIVATPLLGDGGKVSAALETVMFKHSRGI